MISSPKTLFENFNNFAQLLLLLFLKQFNPSARPTITRSEFSTKTITSWRQKLIFISSCNAKESQFTRSKGKAKSAKLKQVSVHCKIFVSQTQYLLP